MRKLFPYLFGISVAAVLYVAGLTTDDMWWWILMFTLNVLGNVLHIFKYNNKN